MAASCVSAELLKQVHLSGEVSCSSFKPNQFRASFCTNCSNLFDKHSVQAIPDDETLRRAIEYSQKGEQSASCVVPTSGEVGGIYLGGFKSVLNFNFLRESNIKHILNTAKGLEIFGPKYLEAVKKAQDEQIQFLNANWEDTTEFTIPDADLAKSVEFIHKARQQGSSVLVHCAQGKSRSSTAVIAYLMVEQNCSCAEALARVQEARKMAGPNPTFMKKLNEFEKSTTISELRDQMKS